MGYYQNNRAGSRNNSRNSNRSYGGGGGRRKGPNKQYIHPSKFVKAAKPVEVTEYTPMHTFADFNLHELLQNNLDTLGYTYPSAIQDQALQPGLAGKDVVGVANTGTGKTAAFGIPMLHKLISERGHRALIMAPTRELAQQIERELKAIGKGCGVQGALLIGGTPHKSLCLYWCKRMVAESILFCKLSFNKVSK